MHELHSAQSVFGGRHEQRAGRRRSLRIIRRDEIRNVAVHLRERFQIAFRMSGRNACGAGGERRRARTAACDHARLLTVRCVPQVIRLFLRPFEPALGAVDPQAQASLAAGNENGLRLRIYGAKGGLEWSQEEPNHLRHAPYGQQPRVITRGGPGATPLAASAARIPSGHPEGYLEAFAQVYRDVADLIAAYDAKTPPQHGALLVPTAKDGLRGVQFVHAAVESSRRNAAWVDLT